VPAKSDSAGTGKQRDAGYRLSALVNHTFIRYMDIKEAPAGYHCCRRYSQV